MLQQTIEKLHAMRLGTMADGLQAQMSRPEIEALKSGCSSMVLGLLGMGRWELSTGIEGKPG